MNETALIVFELHRKKKIIAMSGGKPPDENVTIKILWMSMDPTTKAHVTGKIDMDTVGYVELRQIVQSYTNLINSTTSRGKGGGATLAFARICCTAASENMALAARI